MNILDFIGCGNMFCGGFLVGWYKIWNLLIVVLWGSVLVSFSKLFFLYFYVFCNFFCFFVLNYF